MTKNENTENTINIENIENLVDETQKVLQKAIQSYGSIKELSKSLNKVSYQDLSRIKNWKPKLINEKRLKLALDEISFLINGSKNIKITYPRGRGIFDYNARHIYFPVFEETWNYIDKFKDFSNRNI